MIAADSSVIIAAFATWHEQHGTADRAMAPGTRLISQCAIETYAVLTRLPHPHRAPPDVVADFFRSRFTDEYLTLPDGELRELLSRLPGMGIHGGATYDAMVGATAVAAEATLLSLDQRALPTYQSCGARVRLLGA
jgi:predicted nucleic acid-binding protein